MLLFGGTMQRRTERTEGPGGARGASGAANGEDEADHGPGLVGAAVRAPLSQGRDGSLPLELDGDDLTEPHVPEEAHGEPIEPVLHAPTTTHIEPRPVATGECTVETVDRVPVCEGEER